MSRWPIKSDCANCPLAKDGNPCKPVLSEVNRQELKFVILGEGPGKMEENCNRPFIGPSGMVLNDILHQHNIQRESVYVVNATLCRPRRKLKEKEWGMAIASCLPRLKAELNSLPPNTWILALGGRALSSLGISKEIINWRGYPLYEEKFNIFPALHPAFVLRDPKHVVTFLNDFERFIAFANGELSEWQWPEICIEENDDMIYKLERFRGTTCIGVDVETGMGHPLQAPLKCVGIANGELAVSVPWPPESSDVENSLREILADEKIEKVFQNGNHDLLSFHHHSIVCNNYAFDTLHAHHVIAPTHPHDLGYIASMEFPAPRWKTEFKVSGDEKGGARFDKADPIELRTYNAKDAYMTYLLREPLEVQLKEMSNGEWTFNQLLTLNNIAREMTIKGIQVNETKRLEHKERLKKEIGEAKIEFFKKAGIIDDLNMNSTKQLRELFFKKFNIRAKRWTPGGDAAIDKDTLESIVMETEGPAKESAIALLRYRKWMKDLTTYVTTKEEANEEGRKSGLAIFEDRSIHPSWRAALLITGRWASQGPNMQNITKGDEKRPGLRDMYCAREGKSLIEADYSQLELRIIALLASSDTLIRAYGEGADIHTENCIALGMQPKKHRRLAKIFVYLTNYGGTPKKLHEGMIKEGFVNMTEAMCKELQERWYISRPELKKWQDKLLRKARKNGCVELPLSETKINFYLGNVKPTEVFNYPIQGSASYIMNASTIKVYEALKKTGLGDILLQVHDALVVECPDENVESVVNILKSEMTTKIDLNERSMSFPVDIKVGKDWGNMKEVE